MLLCTLGAGPDSTRQDRLCRGPVERFRHCSRRTRGQRRRKRRARVCPGGAGSSAMRDASYIYVEIMHFKCGIATKMLYGQSQGFKAIDHGQDFSMGPEPVPALAPPPVPMLAQLHHMPVPLHPTPALSHLVPSLLLRRLFYLSACRKGGDGEAHRQHERCRFQDFHIAADLL